LNKTLSLPVNFLSVMERSGQGEEAQGKELRAKGKPPAFLFHNVQIYTITILFTFSLFPALKHDSQ